MSVPTRKKPFLSALAGSLLAVFAKSPPKPNTHDLSRVEFKTSTQRLGVRFNEKIRNIFRHRWIKKT